MLHSENFLQILTKKKRKEKKKEKSKTETFHCMESFLFTEQLNFSFSFLGGF